MYVTSPVSKAFTTDLSLDLLVRHCLSVSYRCFYGRSTPERHVRNLFDGREKSSAPVVAKLFVLSVVISPAATIVDVMI